MEPEPICVNPKHGGSPQQTAVVTVTIERSAFIKGTVTCKGRAAMHLVLELQCNLRLTEGMSSCSQEDAKPATIQSRDICWFRHWFS